MSSRRKTGAAPPSPAPAPSAPPPPPPTSRYKFKPCEGDAAELAATRRAKLAVPAPAAGLFNRASRCAPQRRRRATRRRARMRAARRHPRADVRYARAVRSHAFSLRSALNRFWMWQATCSGASLLRPPSVRALFRPRVRTRDTHPASSRSPVCFVRSRSPPQACTCSTSGSSSSAVRRCAASQPLLLPHGALRTLCRDAFAAPSCCAAVSFVAISFGVGYGLRVACARAAAAVADAIAAGPPWQHFYSS